MNMKLYKLTTIVLFVLILVAGFETSAQDNQWVYYGPTVVQLKGRLVGERRYGPPGFGENPKTDAKMRVLILVLFKPVNVRGNPEYFPFNVDIKDVSRMQLMVYDLKAPYMHFIGGTVVVKGTLVHAHTGSHFTDVLMDVQSINRPPERRRSVRPRLNR